MNGKIHGIDDAYIRNRITELREQKGVTEYKMSVELGRGKSYIQNIMVGKALPSLTEFLKICGYLGVTPKEFFDIGTRNPVLLNQAIEKMRPLDDEGLKMTIGFLSMIAKR